MSGTLFLLPNSLGNPDHRLTLPPAVAELIPGFRFYIVENIRNARRYLKSIDRGVDIDAITFFELNKHTGESELAGFLQPLLEGHDTGLLSEAGLPGVADPGAKIVALAHRHNVKVQPLTGPSSLLLSLMASGMNGQSFRFCGYLPVKRAERTQMIRQLENRALKENESQIFIETPYRNDALLADLLAACQPTTMIAIGADLTMESEFVNTLPVSEWKKKKPELHKRPAVFIIGKVQ